MALSLMTAAAANAAPPRPEDIALLNRVTWGVNASTLAQYEALGPDRWLDSQLHPAADDRLPPQAQAMIDAMPISKRSAADLEIERFTLGRAADAMTDPDKKKAAHQAVQDAMYRVIMDTEKREVLRDLYSQNQLKEQMTWFWYNHFNVMFIDVLPMVPEYDEGAIRAHALGHFRDLLEATLRQPAMLQYLNNDQNAVGHINENYARELMELHTMGVGSGYTQKDVEELARILTGLGVDRHPETPKLKPELQSQLIRDGLFEFNPARHDYGDKVFLGHVIKGAGLSEVEQALDILAHQPATARHVSTQLATYFVSDAPPASLVDKMASTFQHTDGDIAAVLKTMFRSPEFKASLGTKFKDPVHYVLSSLRLAYDDRVILNTYAVHRWLSRLSEGYYSYLTPEGYSMTAAGWDGPGQLALRFEIAREIASGPGDLFQPQTPGSAKQPGFPELQSALYYNDIAPELGAPTRNALNQAISAQDWNTLLLSSPEFMRR